jgi:hypothetical protein
VGSFAACFSAQVASNKKSEWGVMEVMGVIECGWRAASARRDASALRLAMMQMHRGDAPLCRKPLAGAPHAFLDHLHHFHHPDQRIP